MALGGCYTCLKYLMFVFNLIFWVSVVLHVYCAGQFINNAEASTDMHDL